MKETDFCFHNLEWPAEGDHIAGPVAWLRGWVVSKPGKDLIDIRVRHDGQVCLGVLGLPRTDLAAHFQPDRSWLPAEFILGVPVTDGEITLNLEGMDTHGTWHQLNKVQFTISPVGVQPPRVEGRLENTGDYVYTVRDAHHPFHGHLDQPIAQPTLVDGRAAVYGWLLDESGPLKHVFATTDGLIFNHLAHSISDPALAAKVTHVGAGQARLRGAVDFPATLDAPACLRVYVERPDESIQLCFAKRLNPVPTAAVSPAPSVVTRAPVVRALPRLPSGRPRRLLMVLRSLQPDDSALRALDIARMFYADKTWAVRIVSTEDGPLRQNFEAVEAESLIVSPEPLLTAKDDPMTQRALDHIKRQIRWDHLDAVAVFNPICGWAGWLAQAKGIPVLLDCVDDKPFEIDPTASVSVQDIVRSGWRSADVICYGSTAAAIAQQTEMNGILSDIVSMWHTPGITVANPVSRSHRAIAPLRTVDWIRRNTPQVFERWQFFQGPATINATERLHVLDEASNSGLVQHRSDWSVDDMELVLGPLFGRGPLRPLLDAAAMGITHIAPDTPTTREIFAGCKLPLASATNPFALARALIEYDTNPSIFARETTFACEQIRNRHSPEALLPRWAALLASTAATKG